MAKKTCKKGCEVYSRIVGYFRPVQNWNVGKKEEFKHRLEFLHENPVECSDAPKAEEIVKVAA